MSQIAESRVRVEFDGGAARTGDGRGGRGYDVVIGAGVLGRVGAIAREAAGLTREREGARVFVVCDGGLPKETVGRVRASLGAAMLVALTQKVTASETEKSLRSAEGLLARMAEFGLERREPVVALGGGIVGDLAGFVAATYRRGVPVVQCPTTLLAMVDASVGGKTGVNLSVPGEAGPELQKNMVGAFWQPRAVVADVGTLGSLPERYFRAGLAECVKHGMIAGAFGDPELLEWTEASLAKILARDAGTLVELVMRNVKVKAAVVGGDEREEKDEGGRALLNLGHTFGHAIETIAGLSPDGPPDAAKAPLQHGEAVGLGLVAATRCAEASGRCEKGMGDRVVAILTRCGLPTRVKGLPGDDEVVRRMKKDKKVMGGKLRLVLPVGVGRAEVVVDVGAGAVEAGIGVIRG